MRGPIRGEADTLAAAARPQCHSLELGRGDEAVALRLWREAGLRVVPGRYLAREQTDGSNPGFGYIRVAMVQDRETTAEALHRLVAVLG